MRNLYFNFNNEADSLHIVEANNGEITIPGVENSPTFDSLQAFAEFYASARDVLPENLKNWELLENGEVVSFVLRAGTAGIASSEIREELNEALAFVASPEAEFHPLDVERITRELADCGDIINALVNAENKDIARAIYDFLNEADAFTPEPVDTRSDIEIFLDKTLERVGTLALVAQIVGCAHTASKDELLTAINSGAAQYTAEALCEMYWNLVDLTAGSSDNSEIKAIALLTQTAPGAVDTDAVTKLITMASIAGRNAVNITTIIVGHRFTKTTATLIPVDELANIELHSVDGKPVYFKFSDTIDAEVALEQVNAPANDAYDYDEDYDDDDWDDEDYPEL